MRTYKELEGKLVFLEEVKAFENPSFPQDKLVRKLEIEIEKGALKLKDQEKVKRIMNKYNF